MTCTDCIKYDACLAYNGGMTRIMSMENKAEENCGHFKNKADYVEVVRCKDCKFAYEHKFFGESYCEKTNRKIKQHHFCGYGKRK